MSTTTEKPTTEKIKETASSLKSDVVEGTKSAATTVAEGAKQAADTVTEKAKEVTGTKTPPVEERIQNDIHNLGNDLAEGAKKLVGQEEKK
eukprot:CAMPEP_0177628206 /NCGR_PEP_ID=MMETSP0447-20121125/7_1 /TAXON_ID=0 /ORGANISM="Stygamoeba regulata, Strain BSH-02190019" /LENGTH=90 /DNA_ID=CAMNT_0019129437 /DNA_START=113 /DNA_END=385 /DNA_ORIENTATION=+